MRTRLVAASLAVALGGAAGIAYATIPDSTGVIHACYDPNGTLRVVDTQSDVP